MPYVIAVVVLVIAAAAFLVLRSPVEAPTTPEPNEAREEAPDQASVEAEVEPNANADVTAETELDATPETEAPTVPVVVSQTYTAEASYLTPRRTEHVIDVTLTIDGTTITNADVTYDGGAAATPSHAGFDNAFEAAVIGQNINTISLSRVGGASLTSNAFNDAVAEIRTQL